MRGRMLVLVLLATPFVGTCTANHSGTEGGAEEWLVVVEGRIGSLDAPDDALTRVGEVLIGPQGEAYISQPEAYEIRVYDEKGEFLQILGRRGEGPGEFGSVDHVGLLTDGLSVSDNLLGRLSLFAFDGQFLESIPWVSEMSPAPNGIYMPTTPQVLLPDSTALVNVNHSYFMRSTQRIQRRQYRSPIIRLDRLGQVTDTLVWRIQRYTSTGIMSSGSMFRFGCPFEDSPLYELMVDGRGVAVVERSAANNTLPTTFSVTLVGTKGDTVFSVLLPYEPIPVSDLAIGAAIDRIRHAWSTRQEPVPDAVAIESAIIDAECIPVTLPPVTDLVTTQDGAIWLRREDSTSDPVTWNILDAGGTFVGTLRLPRAQMVAAAKGDVLVATEVGEFDVPYVIRYRVERR